VTLKCGPVKGVAGPKVTLTPMEFLEEVKGNVLAALDEVRLEVEAQRAAEVALTDAEE
jgi:hypothetical protein